MVQKKIIGTLGIWLMVSAFLLQGAAANINFLIVGIITAISGLTLAVKKPYEGWIGAIAGLWLIISAYIPFIVTIPYKYYNAFIIGAIFIIIGIPKFNKEEDLITSYEYHNKIHTHRNY